ncbi:hypothetical protein Q4511_09595 [Paracoccus sp. 1_MG-2023]|uniref:hypothetical protein n=1 Tax=unclassified Paracoccus (in: a-proteobacteria) TaxID=2688777 RepID=UPI001C0864BC|nr:MULTISPECIES: hypothetical protein [unclassified Paracoccus (in: a-proteobacteria)]MBU2956785.1 hypothetical protein [Paracoccus sp. C2R09]MDO6669176.1 hypothetical protein [Paracoccus sp. 1_MG-2023]
MKIPLALLAAATILSACAGGPSYTVADRVCNPAHHARVIGMNWGEVNFPPSLRVRLTELGKPVPLATDPARLTLHTDPKGWIGRVSCG